LRSALEPGRVGRGDSTVVLRRGSGYMLSVAREAYDVTRFDDMLASGRAKLGGDPARASELIANALGLWRGNTFDDVQYEDFARVEIARLDEARVSALEDRIDADLECGHDGDLVSELEVVRSNHPLRERPVAQLMLALYRSGRPADSLRAFDRFRRVLAEETGLDPSPSLRRLEELILLHDASLRHPNRERQADAPMTTVANPYKGLRPFLEDDADDFFGRDRLVAEMLRVLRGRQSLVTVVGASGSGKSSAVRAGLVPALRKDAIAGSSRWLVAHMVPGLRPFAEIEAALLHSTLDAPASLAEQLSDPEAGILRAVLRVLPDASDRVVLVIDQFEELFTLVNETERTRFLDNLVVALDDRHHRLTVVATLRVDFYGHVLTHPAMGARLAGGLVNVVPLTSDELEFAACQPAARAGVSFEPALLAQIIADVGREPGSLPLFQFTLTDLFDRRDADHLLISTYRSMGGVQGALSRRTTEVFDQLSHDEQRAAEQLFLRLVTVTENDDRTRRRVTAAEILSLGVDSVAMQAVIDVFGQQRLLTFDADPLTAAPTIEVAHEALLVAWPQLSAWIDGCREDIRRHGTFNVALREWELSRRNSDYLLTGARLAGYSQWAASSPMRLTAAEREFLELSTQLDDDLRQHEDERRVKEEMLSHRARRRLWGLAASLAVVGALSAVFLVVWLTGADPPRVGLLAGTADGAFAANINAGLERAKGDYKFDLQVVEPTTGERAPLRDLAQSHPNLIITDSGSVASASDVFADFPDVRFGLIDIEVDAPNAESILFANEQGAFLVGVAAAMASHTHSVGFVGALPLPQFERLRAGFEAGAKSVSPNVTVLATYIEEPLYGKSTNLLDAYERQDLARGRATALYEMGADVVFQAAGNAGFGVFDAAADVSEATGINVWAIGVDNDQWFQINDLRARDHLLTSMIKRADVASYQLAKQYLTGQFRAGVQVLGLADGALDYSVQGLGMTPAIRTGVEQAKVDIISGRITVPKIPTGVLVDLDPLPAGFADAIAAYEPAQLDELIGSLREKYSGEWDATCWVRGTRTACAQFILRYLDELKPPG
jgi:basic membrane lipoprotein Med (substrate-binding protein (PBP1-ABC) superfamily)/DNA-binding SARP family transcriptional activator